MGIEVHVHKEEDAVWVHQRQGASEFGDLALFEGDLRWGTKGISSSGTEGQGHKATLVGSQTLVKGSKLSRGSATIPYLGVSRGQGCGRGR